MAGAARGQAGLPVTRHRRPRLLAALGAVALTLVPATPGGAAGDYQATAAADGVRVGVAVRRFLVVEQFVDAGAPAAQAHVDSLGNSRGWAAHPFPSDLVISVPGTVAGFGPPGLPALPPYPLYASATYPTKGSEEVGGSGYSLRASAEEQAAGAQAQAGLDSDEVRLGLTRAAATARREPDASVVARAASTVEAFSVGDVLRIGRVHSLATASTRPGEPVSRAGETTVAEVTVAGQAVAIGPGGVTTPGGTAPLPDTSPARQALAEAGVTVRYLAPLETAGGVVAAGVEVSVVRDISGVGEAVVSYVLGRASASADAGPAELSAIVGDVPVPGPVGDAPPADGAGGGPVPADPASGSVPGDLSGSALPAVTGGADTAGGTGAALSRLGSSGGSLAGEGIAAAPGVRRPAAPGAGNEAAGASGPSPAAVLPSAPAGAVVPGPDFSGFAPILAAGGLVVAGALVATGRLMRRASWTS